MSGISWTDQTWNPVTGCTPVSPACDHCYAERMSKRLAGRFGYPADEPFRVTLHPDKLDQPLRWRKPRRVFVVSMGDLFHEDVPWWFIAKVFIRMAQAPQHDFQLLTKRPENVREFVLDSLDQGVPVLPNVWLGVTAEDQQRADERIPILLDTPAAVRFVSCEPLLGLVDLSDWLEMTDDDIQEEWWRGEREPVTAADTRERYPKLDWVIAGGETGPGARLMQPEWARDLRDQCQREGVPFHMKNMTGRKPVPADLDIKEFPDAI